VWRSAVRGVASLAELGSERDWGDSSQSNSDEDKRRGPPYNNELSQCGVTPIMYKAKPRTLERFTHVEVERFIIMVYAGLLGILYKCILPWERFITVRVKERVVVVSVERFVVVWWKGLPLDKWEGGCIRCAGQHNSRVTFHTSWH
jgi:hypothetical protein